MFVPWAPHYTRVEARRAIENADSWAQVLEALGYAYHGKNIKTVRKWAARWQIPVDHLPAQQGRRITYTEDEARAAIGTSQSWAEALRKLGYSPTGGNPRTLKRRASEWEISTDHFDPSAASRKALRREPKPLSQILVAGSTYNRSHLKRRLYESGLKERACELCGQGERWRGRRMGLIIDHINGVRDDNRLENLRIVCPNCAATLDTHCGRGNRIPIAPRDCLRCGQRFAPKSTSQRYCSRTCGTRWNRRPEHQQRPNARRAKRPPLDTLLAEIDELGYAAVGRKYGVSDNAIRKWVRDLMRERAQANGGEPARIEIPKRTWPNRRRLS